MFFVCKRHKKGDLRSAAETEGMFSGIQREGKEGCPEVMRMSHCVDLMIFLAQMEL